MKKILVITSILAITVIGIKYLSNSSNEKNATIESISNLGILEKIFPKKNDDVKVLSMMNKSIETSPSYEELEQEYIKKSTKEIEDAIIENNKIEKKYQFIAKANANELDQELTDKFLKYVRLNSTLNKILMERELDNKEGV